MKAAEASPVLALSFSGPITSSSGPIPASALNGANVDGVLRLDLGTTFTQAPFCGRLCVYYTFDPAALGISLDVAGVGSFNGAGLPLARIDELIGFEFGLAIVLEDGSGDRVSAVLEFADPSLARSFDSLRTLTPGDLDLSASSFSYSRNGIAFSGPITSVDTAYITPVPAPGGLAAIGVAALAGYAVRRSGRGKRVAA